MPTHQRIASLTSRLPNPTRRPTRWPLGDPRLGAQLALAAALAGTPAHATVGELAQAALVPAWVWFGLGAVGCMIWAHRRRADD